MFKTLINASRSYIGLNQARSLNVTLKPRKIDAKAMEEDLALPPRPKRPLNPWQAFVRERKDEVLQRKPSMTAAEMSVILAKEWKETDKFVYQSAYDEEKRIYQERLKEYDSSLTNDQFEFLRLKKNQEKDKKTKRELNKTDIPRNPRNAVNFYVQEYCLDPEVNAAMKAGQSSVIFPQIFAKYKSLSDSEKSKYMDMAQHDRLRFKREFHDWYERVESDQSLSQAARDLAKTMYEKYNKLGYL